MKKTKILIFSIILVIFSSCGIIKGLYYFNKKEITLTEKHFADKTIVFVEIHHAGRNVFYQKLSDTIAFYKKNDFVVFYESVKHKASNYDTLEADIIKRKARKIMGMLPSMETYSLFDSLDNFTVQPTFDSLISIDNNDVNADVSLEELISEYENVYGEIILSEIDTVGFNAEYDGKKMKGVDNIVIDFRNKHIAKTVYSSEHRNIIVLFGVAHRKGFFKELANLYSEN